MKKDILSGFRLAIAYQLVMWGIVILFHGVPMTEWNSSEVLAISVGVVLYIGSIIFYLGKTKKMEQNKKRNLKRFEISFLIFYSIFSVLFGILILDFVEKGILYACSGDECLLNASFYVFFATGLLGQVIILLFIRLIQSIIKKREIADEEARKIVLVKFSKVDEVSNVSLNENNDDNGGNI